MRELKADSMTASGSQHRALLFDPAVLARFDFLCYAAEAEGFQDSELLSLKLQSVSRASLGFTV